MIMVWGGAGFIGSRLMVSMPDAVRVTHHSLFSPEGVRLPEGGGVIWAAGWPGNRNVDDVERDPDRSYRQSVLELLELAERCRQYGKRLLVIASGCVFDGLNASGRPHREGDLRNFVGTVYLRHKKEMEDRLLDQYADITAIFRIRVPFDGSHHPRNSLHKLAQFPAVWDRAQSFTWLPDLCRAAWLWREGKIDPGVWHVTQPGTLNNFEAVQGYLNPLVEPIRGDVWIHEKMACPRSAAILDSSKLGAVLRLTKALDAWRSACREYLQDPSRAI